ncbi:MAG: FAD-dependent thymidylate synthase [Bacilli bacterium]|nr:FAD-dependent thymidylate synthase [Bacilli bacterium]
MRILKPQHVIIGKDQIEGHKILKHIEKIARTCYKSEDLINDESAEKMIKKLIKMNHLAMIEHASVSVLFTCDRGVTHEIVRHRVASYAQESTRYVNYSKDKFGNEIGYIDIAGGIALDTKMKDTPVETIDAIISEWNQACIDAEKHYMKMLELGATPQIARSVLNNSTKSDINVTMNLREWGHFFELRCDSPAHPQMRELVIPLLKEMSEVIPIVFDDLVEKFC